MTYKRLNIKKGDYLVKSDIDYMQNKMVGYINNIYTWTADISSKLSNKKIPNIKIGESLAHNIKLIMNLKTMEYYYTSDMSLNLKNDDFSSFNIMVLNSLAEADQLKLKLAMNVYGKREIIIEDNGAIEALTDKEGNEYDIKRQGNKAILDVTHVLVDVEDITKAYITINLTLDTEKLSKLKLVKTGVDNPVVMINIHDINCELDEFVSLGTNLITVENSNIQFTGINMYSYPDLNIYNSDVKFLDKNGKEVE